MDFRVDQDQEALRDGIRSFCEGRFPLDQLGALAGKPLDRAAWRELAEMGVFQLRLPEAMGGLGLGMAEAVLVFPSCRRLCPARSSEPSRGGASRRRERRSRRRRADRMLPSSDPLLSSPRR
jgi:alkylation response protein AidB-like acyl-CoA dehydrogenase